MAATSSVTFSVAKVDPCEKRYAEAAGIPPEDLTRWADKKASKDGELVDLSMPGSSEKEQLSLENGQTNYPLVAIEHRIENAFVATIYLAYCEHYPLEVSVEDFWVAIAQGVSIHLNANSEKYRNLLVSHEGKKKLVLPVDSLRIPDSARPTGGNKSVPAINWPQAVQQMGILIKNDMKTDLTSLLTNRFSGTSELEGAVFDCTLMDSVKSYYEFGFSLMCGLPQVTLRGSPSDFQAVIDRVEQLKILFTDFSWWFDALLPHLKKLKESAEGKADVDWWNTICHTVGGGSDISMLSGWLADFVPYKSDGQGGYTKARRDHHHYCAGLINGIDFSDFSESVTKTPFELDDNGHKTKMQLIAGFLGVGQNQKTGALRPCLGWVTAIPASA